MRCVRWGTGRTTAGAMGAALRRAIPWHRRPRSVEGGGGEWFGQAGQRVGEGEANDGVQAEWSALPPATPPVAYIYISRGHPVSCQHGAFSGVGAFVASFVPAECPVGGGMWVIFGKPLKRAIRNTPGLHAVLTTCLRFLSALDGACVARCLFLLTGSHHVVIQIHTTCCCFP